MRQGPEPFPRQRQRREPETVHALDGAAGIAAPSTSVESDVMRTQPGLRTRIASVASDDPQLPAEHWGQSQNRHLFARRALGFGATQRSIPHMRIASSLS
jgi:hypothetical protein